MFFSAIALGIATAALPLLGSWTGTLTYRDFRSDRTTVLPTTLAVSTAGTALRFAYAFDDGPGKLVRDDARVVIDAAAGTVAIRDGASDDRYRSPDLAALVRARGGHAVLTGTGIDNGAMVDVRETVDLDPTAFVMRREIRKPGGAFFTRHIYRFTRVVPAAALRADAAILRHAYEALHPGLYRYATPAEMAENFARLDRELGSAATLPQAFLAFTHLTASLRCGHSYPNFANQPPALAEAIFEGANRLPFAFDWDAGRMIVTRNDSGDPALAPGSVVTSIDGRASAAILARLMTFARADGANDAKRVDQLRVAREDRSHAFAIYFPLAFPKTSARYALRVTTFGESIERDVRVNARDSSDTAASEARAIARDGPLFSLEPVGPSATILRMPTWETYTRSWDWKGFIEETFAKLAREETHDLIIDLRGNEGGTAVGDTIVAHLIDAPIARANERRLVRYRSIPHDLAPYLDTWDRTFEDWGDAAVPYDDRFFSLTSPGGDDATIVPRAPRYRGHVWVLVDAANSSATFQFDRLVRERGLATLVGRPTGGSLRGIDGGAFFFVRLPNSGIEVDLPLIATLPIAPMPDAGLMPDLAVTTTASDIANDRDATLAAVRAKILERRRSEYHPGQDNAKFSLEDVPALENY